MFSSKRFGILALAIMAAFVLTACGGDDQKPTPTSGDAAVQTANQDTAQEAAVLPADPMAAITQALRQQQTAGPYRVKTTIDADSGKMEMAAEIVPPDRMRMVTDIGGQQQEMVFIGDKGWMKLGEEWTEAPVKASDVLAQLSTAAIDELAITASDMQSAGTETVDGQEAAVYTYNVDMNKSTTTPMDVKSTVKLWVSTASGLPIRQEIEGEAMGVKSKSTQVIEYDASLKIEPPVQ